MRLLIYITAIILGLTSNVSAQYNNNTVTHPRRQFIPSASASTQKTKVSAEQLYSWAVYRNLRALSFTKKYINITNDNNQTALCIAQKRNDREAYKILLNFGASTEVDCHRDDAPLTAVKTSEKIEPSTTAYVVGGVAAAGAIAAITSSSDGGSNHHSIKCEEGYSANIKDASDCKTTGSAGWLVEVKGECGRCIKKDKEGNCDITKQSAKDCGEQGANGWEYTYNGYVGNDRCGICTPKSCKSNATTNRECAPIYGKVPTIKEYGFSGDEQCWLCEYSCDEVTYMSNKDTCEAGHGYLCEPSAEVSGCYTKSSTQRKECPTGTATQSEASSKCPDRTQDGLLIYGVGEATSALRGDETCYKCKYTVANNFYDDSNECQKQTGFVCEDPNPNDEYLVFTPSEDEAQCPTDTYTTCPTIDGMIAIPHATEHKSGKNTCNTCEYKCDESTGNFQTENLCIINKHGEIGYTCQYNEETKCWGNRQPKACQYGSASIQTEADCGPVPAGRIFDTIAFHDVYSGELACNQCTYSCDEETAFSHEQICKEKKGYDCKNDTQGKNIATHFVPTCYVADTCLKTTESCEQKNSGYHCKLENGCYVKDESNPVKCREYGDNYYESCPQFEGMYLNTSEDYTFKYSGESQCKFCVYSCGTASETTDGWSSTPCSGDNCKVSTESNGTTTCYKHQCNTSKGYYPTCPEGFYCNQQDGCYTTTGSCLYNYNNNENQWTTAGDISGCADNYHPDAGAQAWDLGETSTAITTHGTEVTCQKCIANGCTYSETADNCEQTSSDPTIFKYTRQPVTDDFNGVFTCYSNECSITCNNGYTNNATYKNNTSDKIKWTDHSDTDANFTCYQAVGCQEGYESSETFVSRADCEKTLGLNKSRSKNLYEYDSIKATFTGNGEQFYCYKCKISAENDQCPAGYSKNCDALPGLTNSADGSTTTTEAGSTCYACECSSEVNMNKTAGSSCPAGQVLRSSPMQTFSGNTCYFCSDETQIDKLTQTNVNNDTLEFTIDDSADSHADANGDFLGATDSEGNKITTNAGIIDDSTYGSGTIDITANSTNPTAVIAGIYANVDDDNDGVMDEDSAIYNTKITGQGNNYEVEGNINITLRENTTDNTAIGMHSNGTIYNAYNENNKVAYSNIIIKDNRDGQATTNTIYGILSKNDTTYKYTDPFDVYNSYFILTDANSNNKYSTAKIDISSDTKKQIYGIYSDGNVYNAISTYYNPGDITEETGKTENTAEINITSNNASAVYGIYGKNVYNASSNHAFAETTGNIKINNYSSNANIYGIYAKENAYNTTSNAIRTTTNANIDIYTQTNDKDSIVAGIYSENGNIYTGIQNATNNSNSNISITGTGKSDYLGMYTKKRKEGKVYNRGNITISAQAGFATGAKSNSETGGYAENSGKININLNSGLATGLQAEEVYNTGTIEIQTDTAGAIGIEGSFRNDGEIYIKSNNGSAFGASNNGTNFALIDVTSTNGEAKGIVGNQLGNIENTGESIAEIRVSGNKGQVAGIYSSGINSEMSKKYYIKNSGNIDVSTSSDEKTNIYNAPNRLYGIYSDTPDDKEGFTNVTASVHNLEGGKITVSNKGTDNNFSVYGIYRGEHHESIQNDGVVSNITNNGEITVVNNSRYNSGINTYGIYTESNVYNTSIIDDKTGNIIKEATIKAEASSGNVYGIALGKSEGQKPSISNTGKIISVARYENQYTNANDVNTYNTAYGIYKDKLAANDTNVINSGEIIASGTNTKAIGVYNSNINSPLYLNNSGTIKTTANAFNSSLEGDLSIGVIGADIDNNGLIQTEAHIGNAIAIKDSKIRNYKSIISKGYGRTTAYGIYNPYMLDNFNDISVTSISGNAYGVYSNNENNNTNEKITNKGNINVNSDSGNAYGIYSKYKSIENKGEINIAASSDVWGIYGGSTSIEIEDGDINVTTTSGTATGVELQQGSISNKNSNINVSSNSGDMYGIKSASRAFVDNNGSIYVNNIDINGDATSASGIHALGSEGYNVTNIGNRSNNKGVYVDVIADNSYGIHTTLNGIDNRGTVHVKNIKDNGNAYGIKSATGSIFNDQTGSIDVQTTSGDAYGIITSSGNITNKGNVNVTSDSGNAYGIYISNGNIDTQTTIKNEGTLTVGSQSGHAYGIYLNQGYAKIVNTGTIELYNNYDLYPSGAYNNFIYVSSSNGAQLLEDSSTCDSEHCKFLASMPTVPQATILNSGTVKFGGVVDTNNMDTELVLEEGGTYEAESFSGDIKVGTSVVEEGQVDTYIAENAIKAEDVSDLNLKSESAMFNTELKQNTEGNYDAVATRRNFDEFAPNKSIANYLEQNYQAGVLNDLYQNLKTQGTDTAVTKDIVSKTGADFLINLPQENINALRDTTEVIADAILTPTEEQYRISSGAHVFYQESDNHGLASGYENTMSSAYMYGDKRLNNHNRLGLGLAFMQMDSSYDMGGSRDENFVTVFVPWLHKFNDNLRLTSILTAGYGYGDYERGNKEADINDYIYGVTNKLVYNVNLADYAELEPALIFNVLGYYQDEMDDDEIIVKAENHLSAEVGAGLFIKKELMNDKYGKLTARIGGVYYHELADPYNKMRAGFKGGVGSYEIDDFANIYSRDRAVLSAILDYNYKKVGVYAKYHHLLQKNDAKNFDFGVRYNF